MGAVCLSVLVFAGYAHCYEKMIILQLVYTKHQMTTLEKFLSMRVHWN